MKFEVLSEDNTPVGFLSTRTKELEKFQLRGSIFLRVQEHFGTMLFQRCYAEQFSVSYSVFQMNQYYSPRISFNESTLYMNLIQHNDLYVEGKATGSITLRKEHFNIRYLPYTDCRISLLPGLSTEFGIHYEPAYLNLYAGQYSAVSRLLDNVYKRKPAYLLPAYAKADEPMMSAVQQVLSHQYKGDMMKLFLEYKSLEILNLALKAGSLTPFNMPAPSRREIEQIEYARVWLEAHTDNPGTIEELARRVGTNTFTLKKVFKQLYKSTVFGYVLTLKMERAMQLLLDTDLAVTDIAYQTGYSGIHPFSKAFRRHFGMSPSDARKGSRYSF